MRKRIAKIVCSMTAIVTLLSAPVFPKTAVSAGASGTAKTKKPIVVVSLGDSYSAGEGIEPFYGQNLKWGEKVNCQDWLAHRSEQSWPGLLKVPGTQGELLLDYKATGVGAQKWLDGCRWYFAASSGAETIHFYESQTKDFDIFIENLSMPVENDWGKREEKLIPLHLRSKEPELSGKYIEYEGQTLYASYINGELHELDLIIDNDENDLPRQLDIFDTVKANGDTVDYVTMTIGGNDVGFAKIVECCAKSSSYLDPGSKKIDEMISKIWDSWDDCYRPNIKGVYESVLRHIDDDAYLIIAGYPKLFEQSGKGFLISQYEAQTINKNVTKFNASISHIIDSMQNPHIVFVGVEDEFNGHEAFSDDPWLNEIYILSKSEDLVSGQPSSYSMHPNDKGAQAYAKCVNTVIEEIEKKKAEQADGTPVYGIAGAEWAVDPTIEADDIIVGDRFSGFSASVSCPYVYIRRDGKYGLIGYDGDIAVKPEYDSFNGNGFYGLDDFIAVYDSKSGDTIFAQNNDTIVKGKWKIVNVENAFGQPGIGSSATTYFINENDGELYRFNTFNEKPEEITDGPDTSYIVQKINCVVSGYGIGKSSAADEKFYLYNDLKGEMLTDGYKYVCSNGDGTCTYSGAVGSRVMTDGYKTAAFSNDMKKWDIYDSYGVLIAKDLEPFDCNLDLTTSWAPATSFFDDADNYDSAKNTHGKAVPFCATEGYIAAKKDGKCGYLDLDGNEVVPFGILEDVRPVHDGKAWAKFEDKWGVLSFETVR